jgi:hypothetical protein
LWQFLVFKNPLFGLVFSLKSWIRIRNTAQNYRYLLKRRHAGMTEFPIPGKQVQQEVTCSVPLFRAQQCIKQFIYRDSMFQIRSILKRIRPLDFK